MPGTLDGHLGALCREGDAGGRQWPDVCSQLQAVLEQTGVVRRRTAVLGRERRGKVRRTSALPLFACLAASKWDPGSPTGAAAWAALA